MDIEPFVPHRGEMRLLDRLVECSEDDVVAECTVRHGIFSDESGLPAWAGLELMAQAVASWAGYHAVRAGTPVKLGFLLGTRRYEAQISSFQFGATLTIHAHRELSGENGLGVFLCRILHEETTLATASLNVFQPPNVEAYLSGAPP
jgi:predicted hotdog family 3-hydroxylacyl-ACP dehydratase